MDAKQFAWAYLISLGQANVEPSYYGGTDVVDDEVVGKKDPNAYTRYTYEEAFLNKIKAVGVNWTKTQAPKSSMYSEFEGTFCDPSEKEYLTGTLILKDGSKQFWMADKLVANVFDIMADIDSLKAKFKELGLA